MVGNVSVRCLLISRAELAGGYLSLKFKGEISAGSTDLGVISDKTGQLSSECPLSKEHAIICGLSHAVPRLSLHRAGYFQGHYIPKNKN